MAPQATGYGRLTHTLLTQRPGRHNLRLLLYICSLSPGQTVGFLGRIIREHVLRSVVSTPLAISSVSKPTRGQIWRSSFVGGHDPWDRCRGDRARGAANNDSYTPQQSSLIFVQPTEFLCRIQLLCKAENYGFAFFS
jgi:hypothetical protein